LDSNIHGGLNKAYGGIAAYTLIHSSWRVSLISSLIYPIFPALWRCLLVQHCGVHVGLGPLPSTSEFLDSDIRELACCRWTALIKGATRT
jgi:hypothetical protein